MLGITPCLIYDDGCSIRRSHAHTVQVWACDLFLANPCPFWLTDPLLEFANTVTFAVNSGIYGRRRHVKQELEAIDELGSSKSCRVPLQHAEDFIRTPR